MRYEPQRAAASSSVFFDRAHLKASGLRESHTTSIRAPLPPTDFPIARPPSYTGTVCRQKWGVRTVTKRDRRQPATLLTYYQGVKHEHSGGLTKASIRR